ncbi:MAG: 16S rRNA (guanine(527)-N(7))-methyltransferase RsmG [Propionibacteriaceae bacterium]|jgi:16S rRNA (guanine527-N7)-methyltransferase|nr:16S rRNA (guanine(527)-N(7))-methyltransferase RsmG [Propionibacteriaceae bacterium]
MPRLRQYEALLAGVGIEWGLLGPREGERIWRRHILNSLAVEPLLGTGEQVCDVGTGAGLPGVPLAVVRPDLSVTLLDSLARREKFLRLAVSGLALRNCQVVRARAEDYARTDGAGRFDAVVCRAVAPLEKLLDWCLPLLAPGGRLLALKGESAAEEAARAKSAAGKRLRLEVVELPVPHADERTWAVVATTA